MAKIPLDNENQGQVKVPLTEDAKPAELHERGVTAVMVAKDSGRDPKAAYQEATSPETVEESDSDFMLRTHEARVENIKSQAEYAEPVDLQRQLIDLEANLTGYVDNRTYRESVKSMPSSVDKTEEEIDREATYAQLRETFATATEDFKEMGLASGAANVAGIFVPTRKGYSEQKLLRAMGFEEGFVDAVDTWMDPTGSTMKFRQTFAMADDAGKKQMLEVFAKHIDNVSDNAFIKAEIFDNFFGGYNPGIERLFNALDLTDATLALSGIVKTVNGIRKGGKFLNTFRRMKEPDVEAEIIEDAVKNPDEAAAVGVTPADVGDHLNPFIHGDVGLFLAGASEDQAAGVKRMMQMQEQKFKAITEEMDRAGILDPAEVELRMRQVEDNMLDDPDIIDVSTEYLDETGFKLKYTEAYFDKAGRVRQREKEQVIDFVIDDVGEIRAPLDEFVNKWNQWDPNSKLAGRLRQWYVSDVEKMSRKQEMTAKAFDSMLRDAFKPLGIRGDITGYSAKRSAAKVDKALMRGAKDGDEYTWEELVTKFDLTDKEATAYFGARNVVNHLYDLKNKQIADQMVAEGVKVWDGPEGIMPIKRYADAHAANTAWKQVQADSDYILIPERGLTLGGWSWEGGLMDLGGKADLTKEMIEEAYKKGYVLARNHNQQSFFKLGEAKTQWAFVKAKNVHSPRGKSVLHRIEGYMPKQRTGNYWFVKRKVASGLSGAKSSAHSVLKTEAWSDSVEAAEAFKARQANPDEWEIVFDRELTADQRMYEVTSTHGGMYSGARKTEELEYLGKSDPKFADSFEALQHYINHIGRQYPAALYRMGAERRLVKIAESFGIKGRNLGLQNVLEAATANNKLTKSSREYQLLKTIHDQVSFVNMIPTDEELAMAQRIRQVGMFFDNKFLNKIPHYDKIPKYFYQKAAQNAQPVNLIRGLTFNHLLGMYNPAQLLVQFSGSLISMAIDPVGYPKHVAKMIGWGMLDQVYTDPGAQKKIIKWMKEQGLGEYAEQYDLWRKSGYMESVTQGNADYVSIFTRNLPYDMNILRKVAANHTLFYKMGELANTRVAFSTAIDRYKKFHNVSHISADDTKALDWIGVEAEKLRLNMSRANQSSMNKGWKGAPLQFQQVISKYFEKVLPPAFGGTDEFTSLEKFRLAAVPTTMTGMVGVPFGQDIFVGMMDLLGVDEKELTEEETLLAKYGAVGWLFNEALDANINLSDRMTLGADIIKKVFEGLVTAKPTWELLGASGTVLERYGRNFQYMTEAFSILPTEEEDTMDDLMMYGSVIAEIASDIPTVSRNMKMYWAHLFGDNKRYVRDGKYMWEWETMNKQTAFMAIAGFQPTEMSEIYELAKEIRGDTGAQAVFGDTDAEVIVRVMNTKLLNGSNLHTSKRYARLVNNILNKYGPVKQQKLMSQVFDKMFSQGMNQNNLMYKALMEEISRMDEGLNFLNTLYARKLREMDAK